MITGHVGKRFPPWQQQWRVETVSVTGAYGLQKPENPSSLRIPLLADKAAHIPSQLGMEQLRKWGPLPQSGKGTVTGGGDS